ncbi:MAG: AI-2E family transporter [Lachnospiraceae bacterium]|nr:AI-2E family transporter [Lachnospiraceae bacterium]
MLFGEKNDLIGRLWDNKLGKGCLVTVFVWFFFRYLFSLAAPFFLAFALITLLYPLLERIQKRIPIKKKFLAAGIVLPVLILVCTVLWAVLAFGIGQLQGLPAFYEKVERQVEIFFHQCCCQLDGRFGWEGERIESYVIEQMTVIAENVQIQVVPQLLSSSYSCFKGILAVVGFLAITVIAVFLFEKDYTKMVDWVKREESFRFLWTVLEGVLSYLVTFFKAQGVILLVIAVLCSVTLSFAGVEGGIFLGILAGFLDMLPFIGTGIVLVPLSVWQLLNGAYVRMVVCLVLYGVCALARELLEPRLIGNKIGVSPVWILFSIYAGVKLFGVGGIVKGPLALIVIFEILKERKEKFDEPFDVY